MGMESVAFTLKEASQLFAKYRNLIEKIAQSEKDSIVCIGISPSEAAEKEAFLQLFREVRCPVKALQYFSGCAYDIVLIFEENSTTRDFYYIDMRSFLAKYNIAISK